MKKIMLLTLLTGLCLLTTNDILSAQSSKNSLLELAEKIFAPRQANSTVTSGQPPVSRKRTPAGSPDSRRDTPREEGSEKTKTERDSDTEARRRRSPAGKPSRKDIPSRRDETRQRDTERPSDSEARERRQPARYPAEQRSPRQEDERRRGGERSPHHVQDGSKAKCGVTGCQHPGKHKGLHKKQNRIRPIRFDH